MKERNCVGIREYLSKWQRTSSRVTGRVMRCRGHILPSGSSWLVGGVWFREPSCVGEPSCVALTRNKGR